MTKKLFRSRDDRVIAGVIGGMAEYFNVDASLLRLIFAFVFIFTGLFPMVLVYIIWWVVVPEKPTRS